MTKISIIGAGMAGLLAGGMLRDDGDGIYEKQSALPNNHTALLRFRTSIVGDTLNIPFRKVKVLKTVESTSNPVADMLSYSLKTNGTATMRSSISARGEMEDRFIAPPDMIKQMEAKVTCPIYYGGGATMGLNGPIISTMPMPELMKELGWEGDKPDFLSVGGYNINVELTNVDAYATVYVPDRLRAENRISLTGSRLTIEVALPGLTDIQISFAIERAQTRSRTAPNAEHILDTIEYAKRVLGLQVNGCVQIKPDTVKISPQRYAKILPIDESIRREFMMWASREHNVYSLGRFATWRPSVQMDDLVNDVRVIQRLISGDQSSYDHRKKS